MDVNEHAMTSQAMHDVAEQRVVRIVHECIQHGGVEERGASVVDGGEIKFIVSRRLLYQRPRSTLQEQEYTAVLVAQVLPSTP